MALKEEKKDNTKREKPCNKKRLTVKYNYEKQDNFMNLQDDMTDSYRNQKQI